MQESVFIQRHPSKACWEIWLSDEQPNSDYKDNGSGHCAWLQSCKVPDKKKWKMYAIKPALKPKKPALAWVAYPDILHRS